MPARKKKFIDKKNAVSFHLVHRSQKDPLQACEEAPKNVLLHHEKEKRSVQLDKQQEFGIFYDDDYDYLQHLRNADELNVVEPIESFRITKNDEKSKEHGLILSSELFASEVETEVGLLNKAIEIRGPRPDWDPDIVAALDDDFNFEDPENVLDDDFINKAMVTNTSEGIGPALEKDNEEYYTDEDDVLSDEADFSENEFSEDEFFDVETKTQFTNYSMTSSVIRRNQGLTMLDDRFEKIFEEYDESEMGPLDNDDIKGNIHENSGLVQAALEEFEKNQKLKQRTLLDEMTLEFELNEEDDTSDAEEFVKVVIEDNSQNWDCESILSTYSNIYNHPKLIEEPKTIKPIRLTKRLAIPEDVITTRGLTQKQIEHTMNRLNEIRSAPIIRDRNESKDEKKIRKQLVKEERQLRRLEKKTNKTAFKEEKKNQEIVMSNVHNKLKGIVLQ